MLQPTSLAPIFTLPDQNGTPVSLASLRGRWVVLYFYPKDDTPGCTIEACEFTASLPAFGGLNAEVLGCSADDATAHTAFIAKHRLGIRLLTDADRSVMKSYGAFGKKMLNGKEVEGVIRSTVLIAPDGTVAHHWETVKAEGHAEQVRSKLLELQGRPVATPVQRVFGEPTQPRQTVLAATKMVTTPAPAKKPVSKPAASKLPAARKAAAKKTVAKKTAKKTQSKKRVAKKPAARKPAKKVAARPAAKASKKTKA